MTNFRHGMKKCHQCKDYIALDNYIGEARNCNNCKFNGDVYVQEAYQKAYRQFYRQSGSHNKQYKQLLVLISEGAIKDPQEAAKTILSKFNS